MDSANMPQALEREFETKLNLLKDWPERAIIFDVSKFSEHHIYYAYHIANTIISRLCNPMTNLTFKLPIFYLMDSMMKHVGGPYAALFSRHLEEVFTTCYDELPSKDRDRMDFLLGTWEERNIIDSELLYKIRFHINLTKNPNFIQESKLMQTLPEEAANLQHISRNEKVEFPSNKQIFVPFSKKSRFEPIKSEGDEHIVIDSSVKLLVGSAMYNEMEKLLNNLYESMKVSHRIPLDDLFHINPKLFNQIKEESIISLSTPCSYIKQIEAGEHTEKRQLYDTFQKINFNASPPHNEFLDVKNHNKPMNVCGFITEESVTVDVNRAVKLIQKIQFISSNFDPNETTPATDTFKFNSWTDIVSVHRTLGVRLKESIESINIPPKLPPILLGPLPLEITLKRINNYAFNTTEIQRNVSKPILNVEDLNKRFNRTIAALYSDLPHQYTDDGIRFRTLIELAKHTDNYLVYKSVLRKRELMNEKLCNLWYLNVLEWITELNSKLKVQSEATGRSMDVQFDVKSNKNGNDVVDNLSQLSNDVFIVPADENFMRCPISKEVFETIWDEDEGELMCKNAARILVTKTANYSIFKLGKPTSQKDIHYLVVHKILVLDHWIASGCADSLKRAKQRYEQGMNTIKGQEISAALTLAAGGIEDECDIFVMLELS